MKLSLRIITLLCYLLPCCFFLITCNDSTLNIAYNQHEADSLANLPSGETVTEVMKDTAASGVDTIDQQAKSYDTTADSYTNDTVELNINNKDFMLRLLFPTRQSLSALGAVFYFKNITGQIIIGFAVLLSLALLLAFKWLKKIKLKMIILLMGILSLLVFIVDSILCNVTLMFGIWILLALLVLQYWIEWKKLKSKVEIH